ncbi:MAG: hypothetical protein ACYDBV_04960 [Nitrospiria bacterium]
MNTAYKVTWETALEVANLWERYQRGRLYSGEEMIAEFWEVPAIQAFILNEPLFASGLFKKEALSKEVRDLITQVNCLVNDLCMNRGAGSLTLTDRARFKILPDSRGVLRKRDVSIGWTNLSRSLLDALVGIPLWKIGQCAGCFLFFPKKDQTTKFCTKCSKPAAQKKQYEKNKAKKIKRVLFHREIKKKFKEDYAVWIRDWKKEGKTDEQILKGIHRLIKRDGLEQKVTNNNLREETLMKWIKETRMIKGGKKDGATGKKR